MTEQQVQKRRLAILQFLSIQRRYTATVGEIVEALDAMGLVESSDGVRAHADFLSETGLAVFAREKDVLSLSERGLNVANGRASATGVATPPPEA